MRHQVLVQNLEAYDGALTVQGVYSQRFAKQFSQLEADSDAETHVLLLFVDFVDAEQFVQVGYLLLSDADACVFHFEHYVLLFVMFFQVCEKLNEAILSELE